MLAAAPSLVFRRLASEVFRSLNVDACSIKKTGLISSRFRVELCVSVSSPFSCFLLKDVIPDCVCLSSPIFNAEKRKLLVLKTNFSQLVSAIGCFQGNLFKIFSLIVI